MVLGTDQVKIKKGKKWKAGMEKIKASRDSPRTRIEETAEVPKKQNFLGFLCQKGNTKLCPT